MNDFWIRKRMLVFSISLLFIGVFFLIAATRDLAYELENRYANMRSIILYDRNGKIIDIKPNARGYYASYINEALPRVSQLLLQKEDRYFYAHPGVNPLSIARAGFQYAFSAEKEGSSTLTQQLVKILLEHERSRTVFNKLKEALYALALELHASKEQILAMYLNSAYFGSQAQGIKEAARFYFGVDPDALNDAQIASLLKTLQQPSKGHPAQRANQKRSSLSAFELRDLGITCPASCRLTIDEELTERIRHILSSRIMQKQAAGVNNGAVVILKLPENELLAVVGSPDPTQDAFGYQINMAKKPRPIGSTAKPFIYLKGFEKGLRPYTLVDDKEYKYPIGTGFALYPKNYDFSYRGEVNLHYALSNSLNVPTVKVLEYAGVENFNDFLSKTLGFTPLGPLESYQLGIALGGLEMDPLTLAYFTSIFPNEGMLKPLKVFVDVPPHASLFSPPMAEAKESIQVADGKYAQLVTKILSDRQTGVEQFGIASSLNLSYPNYAVKTGTSREFLDSWTVGFTPDFLVAVWMGNADNRAPSVNVSGQEGAGEVWHDVMELLLNSSYHKKTPFEFGKIREMVEGGMLEYGLEDDVYEEAKFALLAGNDRIILEPYDGDTFLLSKEASLPLKAKHPVSWIIDGKPFYQGRDTFFTPPRARAYEIEARDGKGKREIITIHVHAEEE